MLLSSNRHTQPVQFGKFPAKLSLLSATLLVSSLWPAPAKAQDSFTRMPGNSAAHKMQESTLKTQGLTEAQQAIQDILKNIQTVVKNTNLQPDKMTTVIFDSNPQTVHPTLSRAIVYWDIAQKQYRIEIRHLFMPNHEYLPVYTLTLDEAGKVQSLRTYTQEETYSTDMEKIPTKVTTKLQEIWPVLQKNTLYDLQQFGKTPPSDISLFPIPKSLFHHSLEK